LTNILNFADANGASARADNVDDRVQLSSYPYPPATVIQIGGEVDTITSARVADYLFGFFHIGHPLVVDLSRVDFLDPPVCGYCAASLLSAIFARRTGCW
jgi:hypothetical protein